MLVRHPSNTSHVVLIVLFHQEYFTCAILMRGALGFAVPSHKLAYKSMLRLVPHPTSRQTFCNVARSNVIFPVFTNARAVYVRRHAIRITSTHYVNASLDTHYISLTTQNTHKTGKTN